MQLVLIYTSVLTALTGRLDRMVNNERGAITSEYGTVILVAIALALAVLALFTHGVFDKLLGALLSGILERASDMAR